MEYTGYIKTRIRKLLLELRCPVVVKVEVSHRPREQIDFLCKPLPFEREG